MAERYRRLGLLKVEGLLKINDEQTTVLDYTDIILNH